MSAKKDTEFEQQDADEILPPSDAPQHAYRYGGRRGLGGMPTLPVLLAKGIAGGIGLVSEGLHHHKENKKKKANHDTPDLAARDHTGLEDDAQVHLNEGEHLSPEKHQVLVHEEHDEEQWILDDAQNEADGTLSSSNASRPKPSMHPRVTTQNFLDRHPAPSSLPKGRLAVPVVLPQRRPETRARGFIRAYAPELGEKGIDQATFLDFLETFNEASQASPLLDAINLAGLAFIPLPFGINQAATIALYLTVEVAKAMQSRARCVPPHRGC